MTVLSLAKQDKFDCDYCGEECNDIYQLKNDPDSFICEECYLNYGVSD